MATQPVLNGPRQMTHKKGNFADEKQESDESTAAYGKIMEPNKRGLRARIKKRESGEVSAALLSVANLCVVILTEFTFRGFCLSKGGHPLRDLAQNAGNQVQAADFAQFFMLTIFVAGVGRGGVGAQHAAPLHRDDDRSPLTPAPPRGRDRGWRRRWPRGGNR